MKVCHGILGGARHRHAVAAAELVGAERGSRAIIGAHSGEDRDDGKDRFAGFGLDAPNIGAIAQARLENDDRAPGALAPKIELAAAADIDQAGEVAVRCGGAVGDWRLNRNEKECGQGEMEDDRLRHRRPPLRRGRFPPACVKAPAARSIRRRHAQYEHDARTLVRHSVKP
jgi:hypothetical protein